MIEYDKNIDSFKNLENDFATSDDALWAKIDEKTILKKESKTIKLGWKSYGIAASIAILVGMTMFLKLYSIDIIASKGQHISHELPDGSMVQLNAASSIHYKPYWWNMEREVELSGEAFFEVEKGESFTVISEEGKTTVLGTSFNIFARDSEYQVYCKSGKVEVASNKYDIHYRIIAGELALIDNLAKSGMKKQMNARDYTSWIDHKFSFTNEPLTKVFQELERQYNIHIDYSEDLSALKYGAYFERPQHPDLALDLICIQFQLNFEETANGYYKVFRN
ncbi:FecR family protein [Methanococcoides sp. SA1]|uniref:FecR family protein n=1 Tax=unclassified Lentimicrobium TaxID=2677434 RepID=UPI0015565D8A|nr:MULTISPECIES: FecR family protein [unclassified Lentimicrobium]NPD47175.1 FecR family protein [Lentimicrobium sp. S6]NPD84822.1 FecR family protein [Lentimicrobium sp. L6]NPE28832.1 FecR family protein [Methanococcoides sp. SA1]